MDDRQARAILREHDENPPAKGRLSPEWRELAEGYRDGEPATVYQNDVGADLYDGGVTADDFGPDPFGPQPIPEPVTVAAEPPAEPPAELVAERKPRKVKTARPSIRDRIRPATGSKAKRKHPRVSVAPLITHGWAALGGLAAQVDRPLGTCLQMQAPVAGAIFEDIVKGTIVDRGLQPLARAEDKAEKVLALAGPPLCVAGLEIAQRLPEPQRKAREAILFPLLIESLVLAERVGGQYTEAIAERAQQEGPARERAAKLAELIFGANVAEAEPDAA